MRSFGQLLFRLYRILSVAVIIIGTFLLIVYRSGLRLALDGLMLVIIVDLLLLCTITLISAIRRGGKRSIFLFFYSTRFRLTLWYAFILALVLLVFSSIVYEAVKNDLDNATYSTLRSRLTQIASTYSTQTNRLLLTQDGDTVATSVSDGRVSQMKLGNEIVLLTTPQGQVLQMTPFLGGDPLSALTTATAQIWRDQAEQFLHLPKYQLVFSNIKTNVQLYEFGGLQSYSFPFGSYAFDQGALLNQRQQVMALLVVGIPSEVESWLSELLSVLTITPVFMLLLASIGGYWLAGRAMRPVQSITRTAQQIGETDLHRRLKLKQRDELGELAATFDRMLDRLEAAFERQRQFTRDASHELRTPLSIVDLEATRALARELTVQEYQQAITTIQQENRHMTRLVNDLLVLARADAGQAKLKHEEVELSEVMVDTVERLAHQVQGTGITINVAPLPELTILGDRTYLVQLLTNIIENALKYSAGTGTHVDIELLQRHRQEKGWAVVCIRDDGPGIAKEHLPHLFERFYRVDQSRTHSQETPPGSDTGEPAGNGLGLSIAQWIAQAHGGEIQVRSAPGHGSVFEIWLPLEPAHVAQQESHFTAHTPHGKKASKQKESIRMSQHMDFKESSSKEQPSYSVPYQETPDYNSYATGFETFSAGQKLSGPASMSQTPTASQRLALAIASLVLWVIAVFGVISIAAASHAPPYVGIFILLGMIIFSALVAVINIVFNRGACY